MKVMSGLDARFLYSATPTVHMHTLKVVVVDISGTNPSEVRANLHALIEARLHRMPMLRRRIVPVLKGLGNPLIIDDADFDLNEHLRFVHVEAPGDQHQLDQVIAETAGIPLDPDRPLWELTVVDGLERGRMAFVMKLHHALADGVASAAMMENAFILDEDRAVVEEFHPGPVPPRRQRYRSAASSAGRAVRTIPRVARQTVSGAREARVVRRAETTPHARPFSGPRTPFNVALTADRTFATLPLPLPTLLKVKDAAGVKLNDAFLALCGGGIRRYLERNGGIPTASLIASVPMATRTDRFRLGGNHVDNLFVHLRTDEPDPLIRVREIHESSVAARRARDAFGTELFELRSGLVPAGFHGLAPHLWGMTGLANHLRPPLNLIASCVRGPRDVLEVDGAVVTSLFSCGPILEGIGLNITAWSYIDTMYFSILGCSASLPDPCELASDIELELEEWVARL